ncbi:MAG: hypothetical protein V1899_12130 [Planctomycetota bacterium]
MIERISQSTIKNLKSKIPFYSTVALQSARDYTIGNATDILKKQEFQSLALKAKFAAKRDIFSFNPQSKI